jgi:hypothetical protein
MLATAREQQRMSTRELARAAEISQPYVVALERVRTRGSEPGPTPSVDVVARLAHALGMDPVQLFRQGLRPVGRHVLLIADNLRGTALDLVSGLTGQSVNAWVTAGRFANTESKSIEAHTIRLRRRVSRSYDPATIEASLNQELQRIASKVRGRTIGLAFNDMSGVLSSINDAQPLLEFEHRWGQVVTDAAKTVGAHAAWNVCVYEISALRALPDAVTATADLIRSHDTIWTIQADEVFQGARSARRILKGLSG